MMSAESNLFWARKAVGYTRQRLPTGASNKLANFGIRPLMCVTFMRRSPSPFKKHSKYDFIRSWAARARHFRCGNCAEQAAVAYVYLEENGIQPLHYMAVLQKGDHGFVVIGRGPTGKDGDISSWGPHAVVCDPWHGDAYPASQSRRKMPGIVRAKTIWPQPAG